MRAEKTAAGAAGWAAVARSCVQPATNRAGHHFFVALVLSRSSASCASSRAPSLRSSVAPPPATSPGAPRQGRPRDRGRNRAAAPPGLSPRYPECRCPQRRSEGWDSCPRLCVLRARSGAWRNARTLSRNQGRRRACRERQGSRSGCCFLSEAARCPRDQGPTNDRWFHHCGRRCVSRGDTSDHAGEPLEAIASHCRGC